MATVEKQYLDVNEFSQLTGLSAATIRRRVRDGSIKAYQPGGPNKKLLIPRDALEAGTTTGRVDPGPGRSSTPMPSDDPWQPSRSRPPRGPPPRWFSDGRVGPAQ